MPDDNGNDQGTLPTATRLVGIDLGHTIRAFNLYKPFALGDRILVEPPGTVAIVRGSRTVEIEDGELLLEYVVELERPGTGVSQS